MRYNKHVILDHAPTVVLEVRQSIGGKAISENHTTAYEL